MKVTVQLPTPLLSLEIEADVERESGPGLSGHQVDVLDATALWNGEPIRDAAKRLRWQLTEDDLEGVRRFLEEAFYEKIRERAAEEVGRNEA